MAIYLITGTPGAGKTLNTIEAVHKRAEKESRAVYYANIEGITFANWHRMDDHREEGVDLNTAITPHSWYNAPDGSILLIDECQDFYPSMSNNAKQPDYIMKMATHRHRGYDIYLITQGPNLINSKIKDWVTPHIHYRRLYGGQKTYRYTNEQVINNIRDIRAVAATAIRQKVKLNQQYFNAYTSASVHTQNRRINVKFLLLVVTSVLGLPLCLGLAYYFFTGLADEESPVVQGGQTYPQSPHGPLMQHANPSMIPGLMPSTGGDVEGGKFDPVRDYQPRIAAMPETAPAYDELRRPQTVPKPQCLINQQRDTCACYTQQATVMQDYPDELCRTYATRGYFDPTRKDREPPPPEPKVRKEEAAPVAPTPLPIALIAQASSTPDEPANAAMAATTAQP